MKALFDYKCEDGHITEHWINPEMVEIPCSCGKMSYKQLSAPSYFKEGKFRMDINSDKWAKTREDNYRRKKQQNG